MVPVSLLARHALLVGHRQVHRVDDRGRAVDGERGRDLRQVQALEQDLGLAQVRQRDPDLADLGPGHRMGRVVAALRRQVERHRQAGLALGQQELVALVGFLGSAEARVLADGPQPAVVAVGEDAARERDIRRACRCSPDCTASAPTLVGTSMPLRLTERHLGSRTLLAALAGVFPHVHDRAFGQQFLGGGPVVVMQPGLDQVFLFDRAVGAPGGALARAMACALMPRSTCGAHAASGRVKAARSWPSAPSDTTVSARPQSSALLRVDQFAAAHHAHRAGRPEQPEQVRAAAPGRGDGQLGLDETDACAAAPCMRMSQASASSAPPPMASPFR